MVPAESILNFESKPLFLTKSVKTPSAAGLLQMLPKHTKRTEEGLLSVEGVVEAAIALITDPDKNKEVGLWEFEWGIEFRRDGNWVGGRRRRNGSFGESELRGWQNRKVRGLPPQLCNALISLS